MSLTPYVQASTMFAMNNEVADRQALAVEQMFSADYYIAKRDYKLGHERFKSRGAVPPAPIPDEEDEMYAISTYTCCKTPEMSGYYDRTMPDTRDVNKELMERAQLRRREDLARRARAGKVSRRKENPIVMLMEREKDEYDDIVDIEAAQFKKLAKEYYHSTFAEMDYFLHVEREARKTLIDIEASVALGLLAMLREKIEEMERRLIVRSTALYPDHFPRKRIRNRGEAEEEEEVLVLDSMYAVPLWQRVMTIREETMSEEDITYRTLLLGLHTQRDLIKKGYLRINPNNGLLQRPDDVIIPYPLKDAVQYAFKTERLSVEIEEEYDRMDVVDEAHAVSDALLDEWVNAIREDGV